MKMVGCIVAISLAIAMSSCAINSGGDFEGEQGAIESDIDNPVSLDVEGQIFVQGSGLMWEWIITNRSSGTVQRKVRFDGGGTGNCITIGPGQVFGNVSFIHPNVLVAC